MEPEEEPGGAAVREVYEEVTKTNKKKSSFCLPLSSYENQEERGNSASFIQDLTETSMVVKLEELQFCVLGLGYSVVR